MLLPCVLLRFRRVERKCSRFSTLAGLTRHPLSSHHAPGKPGLVARKWNGGTRAAFRSPVTSTAPAPWSLETYPCRLAMRETTLNRGKSLRTEDHEEQRMPSHYVIKRNTFGSFDVLYAQLFSHCEL